MPFSSIGIRGLSSSGGTPSVFGNGLLTKVDDQISTLELQSDASLEIENPEGRDNPFFRVNTWWLGKAYDLDLRVAGDKPIRIIPSAYVPRRLLLAHSDGTPTGCVASLWTAPGGPGGTGEKLLDIAAADLTAKLVSNTGFLDLAIPIVDVRVVDHLFIYVSTVSSTYCTTGAFVHGDATLPPDDRIPI